MDMSTGSVNFLPSTFSLDVRELMEYVLVIISILGLSLWRHEQWTLHAIDHDINRLLLLLLI